MTTTTVTILDPERAAAFRRVYGTATVPVTSMFPHLAELPGLDGPRLVYLVPLDWIEAGGHRAALVEFLAARFGADPADVWRDLVAQGGLPVLAEGCTVTSDSREFL